MTGDIEISSGATTARVLPELGFNCYSFVVDGFDHLHRTPDFSGSASPTRSGIPILFPWPNRIADARFTWAGVDYDLPVTEPHTGASIHGFACFRPWRVLSTSGDRVTGEFVLSRDAPGSRWPADAGLRVTYAVQHRSLTMTAEVFAADGRDLPFGLGFHPYFRVPGPFAQWRLQCDAGAVWPLRDMIPTGEVLPVPPRLDFRTARGIGAEHLDDVLTGLPHASGLTQRATLTSEGAALRLLSDPGFRDYVLFTPSSRDALAIEPYTCTTDAVNLAARGVDGGWQVLPGGDTATLSWRVDIT